MESSDDDSTFRRVIGWRGGSDDTALVMMISLYDFRYELCSTSSFLIIITILICSS